MVKTGPKKLLKMWQHFTDQEHNIFLPIKVDNFSRSLQCLVLNSVYIIMSGIKLITEHRHILQVPYIFTSFYTYLKSIVNWKSFS